jgi:hypothetical protein
MGLILLIIARILSWILFPIGWIYSLITFRLKLSRLNEYAFTIALSLDQLGNVVLANIMNDFLIKSEGYKFGNPDDTISAVLGVNKLKGTLSPAGKAIAYILNKVDHNHVEKASKYIILFLIIVVFSSFVI